MSMPVLFFLILIFSNVQGQTLKEKICSHSWQQRPSSIVWNFTDDGNFSAILFWANKKKFGFTAKKGTYSLDDSTKILKVLFDSTYSVFSKDSFSVSRDSGLQEWHLITISDYKIELSRPPIWEFEKRNAANVDNSIFVTLDGSKRKPKNVKQKNN